MPDPPAEGANTRHYLAVFVLGSVLLALLALMSLSLAVMPTRLRQWLRQGIRRDQDRMRNTGEWNPYVGPNTDPDRFLDQLRWMAAGAAFISVGTLIGLAIRS